MKKLLLFVVGVLAASVSVGAQLALPKVAPTVDQILSLKRAASPYVGPMRPLRNWPATS